VIVARSCAGVALTDLPFDRVETGGTNRLRRLASSPAARLLGLLVVVLSMLAIGSLVVADGAHGAVRASVSPPSGRIAR